jgi:hypothetical protein
MHRSTKPTRIASRWRKTNHISSIYPSPENTRLYRAVDPADPEIVELAESIRERGVLEPLVITADNFIVSGHRRHAAARIAGLDVVPCRRVNVCRAADPDGFLRLLAEHNRQRIKTRAEALREELIEINPDDAHEALTSYRRAQAAVDMAPLGIQGKKRRAKISAAKRPFLDAAMAAINERRAFWPLSDRQVHYALLNCPPLIHAGKPKSRYANNARSYKALTDILTRARIDGLIPFAAIADETRPVVLWPVHQDSRGFIRYEMTQFLRGYWRDLLQSQPSHIELLGEKNTVASILREVAADYCIPLTTGRGYCSLPPRYEMAQRFRRSGKDRLILLVVSDFDPEGEDIAHSMARSLRDDFGIDAIHPIKVALTAEQVRARNLPPNTDAKKDSSRYRKFVRQHGESVYELEALPPAELQQIVREAIEGVIDRAAYAAEIEAEKADAAFLEGVRRTVHGTLADMDLGGDDEGDSDTDDEEADF